jgi:C_GCAxxG_C_C family probable redox protein
MQTKSDLAAEKFAAGYNCAQSVAWAFADELGLDKNMLLKLATGLGGGMGHMQEVCGAVSGGVLALGAKFGRDENGTRDQTNTTYAKTRELFARFQALHGTCLCGELLPDCDLNTAAGQQKFKEQNLRNLVCTQCVRDATTLVEELLH